jgi:hypothetical protein
MVSCNEDDPAPLTLDFDVTIPENWSELVMANEGYVYVASRNGIDVKDTIRETLQVYKEKLPNKSLISYYALISIKVQGSSNYGSLLYASDTVINDTDFKKMISRETFQMVNPSQDTFDLNVITNRYFFYEQEHGYQMMFTSIDTLYDENKAVFDAIIGSFHYKTSE